MPSSFIREEGYRAVMLMRAGPVGANHKAVLSVSARSMSSRCFFGMPRSTASTFKHSRRSEPIRLDSAGSSFLKFAKSQRSFRNIAKIIIIYDDQEICYEIFFSSSSSSSSNVFSLSLLPLMRRLLLQRRCTCFVIFWNFLAYRLLKPNHVG